MALDPKPPNSRCELRGIIHGRLNSANRTACASRCSPRKSPLCPGLDPVFEEVNDELFAQFGNEHTPATLTKTEQRANACADRHRREKADQDDTQSWCIEPVAAGSVEGRVRFRYVVPDSDSSRIALRAVTVAPDIKM